MTLRWERTIQIFQQLMSTARARTETGTEVLECPGSKPLGHWKANGFKKLQKSNRKDVSLFNTRAIWGRESLNFRCFHTLFTKHNSWSMFTQLQTLKFKIKNIYIACLPKNILITLEIIRGTPNGGKNKTLQKCKCV